MKVVRRCLSAFLVSIILVFSVSCSYLEVQAAELVETIGGGALFDFMLSLFGVSNIFGGSGNQMQELQNEYIDYLQSEGYEYAGEFTFDDWLDMTNGNSVALTGGLFNSFSGFLDEYVGDLTSGKPQFITGGTYFTNYGYSTPQEISFRNYITSSVSENGYYIVLHAKVRSDHMYYSMNPIEAFDPAFPYNCYIYSKDDCSLHYVCFTSDGAYMSSSWPNIPVYTFDSTSGWTLRGTKPSVSDANKGFGLEAYVSIPFFVVNDIDDVTGSISYSDLVSMSENVLQTDTDYVSLGGYSQTTIDSLIGNTVTKTIIDAVNTAVTDAISANITIDTTTGAIDFTDTIAQAVADAITQTLTDTGVLDRVEPGDNTGEDEEEKDKTLVDVLTGFRADVLDGFAKLGEWIMDIPEVISDAFSNVLDVLEGLWEDVIAIPDAIAGKLEGILGPGGGDGDNGNSKFTADLVTLFPFCIPFDLIACFKLFTAEPEVPEVDVPIHFGIINYDYTFHFSLEAFESVAVVCRLMFLIMYIVSLILVTRQLIRG